MITSGSVAGGDRLALGVVVAVCSAACYDAGYILEKQALATLPRLARRPLPMIRTLARSRRWVVGFVVMLAGLALQVEALTLAPVSIVQPVLAAGVLGVVVAGRVVLGERLAQRERLAVVLVVAAVAAIVVSAGPGAQVARAAPAGRYLRHRSGASWPWRRPWACWSGGLPPPAGAEAVALAVAAGLLYGAGALSEKAVATNLVGRGVIGGAVSSLTTAYPWMFLVATLAGLVVFQAGLQGHTASLMVPLANVVASGCAIVGASVVFGELLMPAGWWSLPRWLAFAAVLTALAVLVVEERPARQLAPVTDGWISASKLHSLRDHFRAPSQETTGLEVPAGPEIAPGVEL